MTKADNYIIEKYIPFLINYTMDRMEKEDDMPKDRKEWIPAGRI